LHCASVTIGLPEEVSLVQPNRSTAALRPRYTLPSKQTDSSMSTLEERIQRIEDDSAIRDLVARFADIATRGDLDAFPKLWIPDGDNKPIWCLTDPFLMSATGITEIVAMFDKLRAPRDFFIQLVHTGVLEINGDRATGRWIMHEVAKGPDEMYYNNFAMYEDVMEKQGGKWYFARRDYNYMFLDSDPFTGKMFQTQALASLRLSLG
jgi:hypothetical protein